MSRTLKHRSTTGIVAMLVLVLVALGLARAMPDRFRQSAVSDITEPFFRRLKAARTDRKAQVAAYFEAVRRLAEGVTEDAVMVEAFLELRGSDDAPSSDHDLRLDTHYVNRYGEFFDILFVDRSGYVFHSMRRESDYHSNLFDGPLANTKLSRRLRTAKDVTFIDYGLYPPSDEPASFFAVPVVDSGQAGVSTMPGEPLGWFVLQCPLNRLNSILSDRRGLGRTGEVYCVNAEQRMVTQSRFRPEVADLRLKVDTPAVGLALESGPGRQVIRDYRGVRVLSSFEPFDVCGTKWVIVAEMDEQEAITEHYKRHSESYQREIVRHLDRTRIESRAWHPVERRTKRVDMNEFAKVKPGMALETAGVSTCTAVSAILPGRFAYLAHIGPSDRIYGKPDLGHNDCLGEMLYRLQRHDVYPCKLGELEFTIVAAHGKSLAVAVDRLLELGMELSQITFACNLEAAYANVRVAPEDASSVLIEWVGSTGICTPTVGSDFEDLGSIVKRVARGGWKESAPRSGPEPAVSKGRHPGLLPGA